MRRGRDSNHAYIYPRFSGEVDHEHTTPPTGDNVHVTHQGTKYFAAHKFRMILANDERPRTMHAEAEHTDRELLPDIVGRLLDRHDARRAAPGANTLPPDALFMSATNALTLTLDAPLEIRPTQENPWCVAHNPEVVGSNPVPATTVPATKRSGPPEIPPGGHFRGLCFSWSM
jgi:hypothetical protein